jgi:hypothetical protein
MFAFPPKPGDVLVVGRAASVQFGGESQLLFRVTSVWQKPTYDGWVWLTGYEIDQFGMAKSKREIFVQPAGLQRDGLMTPRRR